MRRQTITFLLALLMSIVGTKALAYDVCVDGIYYNFYGDKVKVTYKRITSEAQIVSGYTGEVIIPNTINYNGIDYSVVGIDYSAFFNSWNLTSVVIPSSVTSIGSSAFECCRELKDISIPSSVDSIGMAAFDKTAWYDSKPNGLVYAGSVAYKYKGNMLENSSISVKEGIRSVAVSAFYKCEGLAKISLPESVERIEGSAFYGCVNLSVIEMPSTIKEVGWRAFDRTKWYNEQPDGLVYAGKVVYKYKGVMPSNTNIILQDGTASITDYAFYGCSGLTSILFANSETNIGSYAFYGCTGLTSVTIPSGVTNIGSFAFYNCSNLTSVTAMMEKPVRIDFYTFSTNRTNATLYVPYGCKAAYEVADNWKDFKEIVEVMFSTDISQMDNVIYIEPTEGRCGSQATLSVKMKNNVAIQTIQFDLYLPDGVTIVPDEDYELVTASKERINRFNYFESSMQTDGALRLLAQATSTNVPAGDGEICQIVVNIPESMEEGDYPLVIKGALMVENDNTSHSPDPNLVQTKLTVLNYVPGDANNDGAVNAIDFNMIGNYILGQSQSGFNVKAADISGDGDVNAIDFNMVGNMILNGSTASARERRLSTNMEKNNEPQ